MNVAHPTSASARRFVLSTLRRASYFFLLAGVAAAGYAGYIIADGEVYQSVELYKFDHHAPLTEPHLLTIGEVVGQIEIPSLALKAVIVHGDSPELLRRGVIHLPETPMPGEWGNVALAGHRDTLFRPLRHIRAGDVITLRTFGGEIFQYQVEWTSVVSPTDIEVLRPSNRRELTLVTCFPFDYVGPAPNRFIVRAIEVAPTKE
jgi:LPXTG-site transpeptidase (sortase) family protein